MIPLFESKGLASLRSLSAASTLYAFDFDGTLSEIVSVAADADLSRETVQLMRELSNLVPVAIISGRSVADLKKRLNFEPRYLAGNHGLEGLVESPLSLVDAHALCESWKAQLNQRKFSEGIEIEDKAYSLSIHFRHAELKDEALQEIHQCIALLHPSPRVIAGKSVVNVLPFGAADKGVAILDLMKRSASSKAFYIGDDDTDEDVFILQDRSIVTVRVGKDDHSHAQYFIERQTQVNDLLRLLIQFHARADAREA